MAPLPLRLSRHAPSPAYGPAVRQGLAFAAARSIVCAPFSGTARPAMRPLLTLMALCGTLALGACGVKGPLEPPPGAHAAAPPPAAAQPAPAAGSAGYTAPKTAAQFNDSATPQADWQKQKKTSGSSSGSQKLLQGVQRPDQPFILDGLL